MAIKRSAPDQDGIVCAWIHGTASRHVARGEPTGDARAAAVSELREVVTRPAKLVGPRVKPRNDLLSREAGLFEGLAGAGEGNDEERARLVRMAALCREAAGADLDEAIVAKWVEVGKERANPPGPGLGRLYSS